MTSTAAPSPSATAAPLPTRLYRYVPLNTDRLCNFVQTGTLRFSDPAKFNDPWDCRPLFDAPPDDRELRAAIAISAIERICTDERRLSEFGRTELGTAFADNAEHFEVAARGLSAYFQSDLSKAHRILCLAAACDVPLMWSHYAAAHTGVCLVFDASDRVIRSARAVEYRAAYPAIPEGMTEAEYARYSFFFKADYWAFEREYRIVARVGAPSPGVDIQSDKRGNVNVSPAALVGIIRGCRMERPQRAAVAKLIRRAPHRIELYQADINHRDYGLTIQRLK